MLMSTPPPPPPPPPAGRFLRDWEARLLLRFLPRMRMTVDGPRLSLGIVQSILSFNNTPRIVVGFEATKHVLSGHRCSAVPLGINLQR